MKMKKKYQGNFVKHKFGKFGIGKKTQVSLIGWSLDSKAIMKTSAILFCAKEVYVKAIVALK